MTRRPKTIDRRGRGWLLPAIGVTAALVSAACLGHVAYQYVPGHAGHLAEAGAALPLSTRLALAISNWLLRLLPFAVIGTVFVIGPLVAVMVGVALVRGTPRWVWTALGTACLFLAVGQGLLCGIILYGIHAAYATLGP